MNPQAVGMELQVCLYVCVWFDTHGCHLVVAEFTSDPKMAVAIRGEIFLRGTLFHSVKKVIFGSFPMPIKTRFLHFFCAAGAENPVLGVIWKQNP